MESLLSHLTPVKKIFTWLNQKLIQPHPSITDVALRQKSLLLSIFLLTFIIVFASLDLQYFLTVPGYQPPWQGYMFLVGSYTLNRFGKYPLASALTISMFPIVVFSNVWEGSSANPIASLYYLTLSLILGSILLGKRLIIALTVVNSVGILLSPRFAPDFFPNPAVLLGPLSTLLIGSVLIIASMFHRDQIEKIRQKELSQSEEHLRLAFESANMGSWDWDMQTNEVFRSPSVEALFGLAPGELEGTFDAYMDRVHEDDRDLVQENIMKIVDEIETEFAVTHRIRLPDQSIRWIESKGRAYYDKKGKPHHMYGIVVDVTPHKHFENEREKLIAELEAKNNELTQFTYTVSHDLKSPLVTITGYLSYIEQDAASGNLLRLKEDTQRIHEAVKKMRALLSELLELSRIGRVISAPEDITFEDLIKDASEIVRGRLEQGQIALQTQPNLLGVYGDRQRLIEALQNLIDNAAKYMGTQPNPLIEIGKAGEENNKSIFFVKDNGIGIAPEYHERIFGLFDKLDAHSEGTGVGLALVKRIIEFHGGRIWVESELGKGATFYFTLPRHE